MTTSKTLHRRSTHKRVFSVAEANATLPLVRAIVSDLVALSRDVSQRRERLSAVSVHPGQEHDGYAPYREELEQIQAELDEDRRRLLEYVKELRGLGVEPAGGSDGLVDFPAVLDGRKVRLCWSLGDPQVNYWHEATAGCGARQALPGLPRAPDRLE